MKTIRILSIITVIALTSVVISSCGSAESKLTGNWITEEVTVSVDSSKANLATIDHAIASSKTTKFTLREDHSMTLIIDGYTTEAYWTYESKEGMLTFRIDAAFGEPISLGKLDGNKIVYTSDVKYGSITAIYVKE